MIQAVKAWYSKSIQAWRAWWAWVDLYESGYFHKVLGYRSSYDGSDEEERRCSR